MVRTNRIALIDVIFSKEDKNDLRARASYAVFLYDVKFTAWQSDVLEGTFCGGLP